MFAWIAHVLQNTVSVCTRSKFKISLYYINITEVGSIYLSVLFWQTWYIVTLGLHQTCCYCYKNRFPSIGVIEGFKINIKYTSLLSSVSLANCEIAVFSSELVQPLWRICTAGCSQILLYFDKIRHTNELLALAHMNKIRCLKSDWCAQLRVKLNIPNELKCEFLVTWQ